MSNPGSLHPECDCGHRYLSHTYRSNTGCFGPCLAKIDDARTKTCDCSGYKRVLS